MRAEWNPDPIDDMRRVSVWVADGDRMRGFGMLDHGRDAAAAAHRAAFDAMLEQIELE